MQISRCPKCGQEPKLLEWLLSGEYEVRCDKCALFGEVSNTAKEAVAEWNELTNEMKGE
jgi:predicted  nucleic acid-binding Zn ribbon protein